MIRGIGRIVRMDRGIPDVDRAVDDELRFHFQMTVEELMAQGWNADDARREATRRFGDVDAARSRLATIDRARVGGERRAEWRRSVVSDVRYALRTVRRAPGYAAAVILTLGLGIGANATMFGVVDRLLLAGPAHVRDADQLVRLYKTAPTSRVGNGTNSVFGYLAYRLLRDSVPGLDATAAYAANEMLVGRERDAGLARAEAATWDYFALLGVSPAMGRVFTRAEDDPTHAEQVVVLSDDYWHKRFSGAPDVTTRTLVIADKPFRIIGVMPKGFTGAELAPVDFWIPMSAAPAPRNDWPTTTRAQWLQIVARLKPGTNLAVPASRITSLFRAAYGADDARYRTLNLSLRPISYTVNGAERKEARVTRWLAAVAAIVLLIACANVANLLLARSVQRRREIAVRMSLGASNGRLVQLLLTEALVLASFGGVVGLAFAYGGGSLLRAFFLPDIAWTTSPVDARVLLFAAATSLVTGLVVALAPAMQISRARLAAAFGGGNREAGVTRSPLRTTLLVTQAALSVMLLVAAGLFVASLTRIQHVDLGVQADRVVVGNVVFPRLSGLTPDQANAERSRRRELLVAALERASRDPSIESATLSVGSPFGYSFAVGLRLPGKDSIPITGTGPFVAAVTSSYFATVGTPMVRGRAFLPTEGRGTEPVAIVNETMARTLWPAADAVGQCLIIGDQPNPPCARIVGVARDAHRSQIKEDPAMQYYVPYGQEVGFGGTTLLVRPRRDVEGFKRTFQADLYTLVPGINYAATQTLQERIEPEIRPWRLGSAMFGAFASLALIVAAVGLYSVIAYLVTQRSREIGVRMALGAQRSWIVRSVLGRGLAAAGAGLGIGLVASLGGSRLIEPLLFETSGRDPVVYAGVAATLVIVSIAACIVPSVRAARLDPAIVLRAE